MVSSRRGVGARRSEVFQSAEECFSAAFEDGLARLSEAVERAAGREVRWLDRVRAGLVALLGFLEDEPGWGRVLFVEAPRGRRGGVSLRAAYARRADRLLDDGSPRRSPRSCAEPQLTAELVIGGVFSVIRVRVSELEGGSTARRAGAVADVLHRGRRISGRRLRARSSPRATRSQPRRSRRAGAARSRPRSPSPIARRWCWRDRACAALEQPRDRGGGGDRRRGADLASAAPAGAAGADREGQAAQRLASGESLAVDAERAACDRAARPRDSAGAHAPRERRASGRPRDEPRADLICDGQATRRARAGRSQRAVRGARVRYLQASVGEGTAGVRADDERAYVPGPSVAAGRAV